MNQKIRQLFFNGVHLWNAKVLLFITISLSIISSYIIYRTYLFEYVVNLEIQRIEEDRLRVDINKSSIIVKNIPLFTAKLMELDKLDQLLNDKLFYSDDTPSMIILLSETIEASGLNIVSINPDSEDVFIKNNIWTKEFHILLQGDPKSLGDFIYELARLKKIIQINEMKVVRISESTLDINMIVSTFYLRK